MEEARIREVGDDLARLDDLVARVADPSLRREMESALAESRRRSRFGLVYEEHIPETSALLGLLVQKGSLAQRREDPASGPLYRVTQVASVEGEEQATVEPVDGGEAKQVATRDLLVVKRFGEPIFPALTPLGSVRQGSEYKPHHAVINGENFHALQLLVYQFEGQVDCIYIDPPYNTGARDWKYNNRYVDDNDAWRHSKWLSMMEKRLRLARRLLTPEGVLIVTIDENEHAHLVMLLERLFKGYEVTSVTIVHNPRGVQGDNFSFTHEYAIFLTPTGSKAISLRRLTEEERKQNTSNLRNWGGESLRTDARNCFYPIYVKNGVVAGFGDVADNAYHPGSAVIEREEDDGDGYAEVWPIDEHGTERKWRYARATVEEVKHQLVIKKARNGDLAVHLAKDAGKYKTVWTDPKYDASSHGTQIVKALTGTEFPFPKSLYAVYEALYAATAYKPDALILDFFAGSGTTLHASWLLNAADQGNRRCVLVTNNEVEEGEAKALNRAGYLRGDAEYERHGIFEQVTVPRAKAALTGTRPDGEPISGNYQMGDLRPASDGFSENIEFYQLNYLDPDEVELGLQFEAILPALWMAAGGVGSREKPDKGQAFSMPEGSTYGVLFAESRFRQFRGALDHRPDVTHIYLVTDSEEAFAEMRSELPSMLSVSMLYRDYLRNFKINTGNNL